MLRHRVRAPRNWIGPKPPARRHRLQVIRADLRVRVTESCRSESPSPQHWQIQHQQRMPRVTRRHKLLPVTVARGPGVMVPATGAPGRGTVTGTAERARARVHLESESGPGAPGQLSWQPSRTQPGRQPGPPPATGPGREASRTRTDLSVRDRARGILAAAGGHDSPADLARPSRFQLEGARGSPGPGLNPN
jgi:hypothetical protein